jgi:serine/threonine protein kinase
VFVKEMSDALSKELFGEYILCLALPLEQKFEEETLTAAIVTARRERRLTDLKDLQKRKAVLNEQLSTTTESSSAMVDRLSSILVALDRRYDELADEESDEKCELCFEAISKITCKRGVMTATETVAPDLSSTEDCVSPPTPPPTPTPTHTHIHPPTTPPTSSPTHTLTPTADVETISPLTVDTVTLQTPLSDGWRSSGKCIILDGVFKAAHSLEPYLCKVKLIDSTRGNRCIWEYNMMAKLNKAHPNRFIRPYAFIDGSKGGIIPACEKDMEVCMTSVCVIMERGAVDLHQHLVDNTDHSAAEKLSFISQLLDILLAAHRCDIVLADFKLSNVLIVIDSNRLRLKAIDFESSRKSGEIMSYETTSQFSCPEVARVVLARAGGEDHPPLLATDKMDVMALGWAAYEIANNMKSFWKNQAVPLTSDVDILTALSNLKDEDVKNNIERTFPGGTYDSLRSWLIHALCVSPLERATSEQLLRSHSLLGLREKTIDHNAIYTRMIRNQEEIITKIDDLSYQLQGHFDTLSTSLDCLAAQIALGSETATRDISSLERALSSQIALIEQGQTLDPKILESAVSAAVGNLEQGLGASIATSIRELTFSSPPSSSSPVSPSQDSAFQRERLDELIEMVKELHTKSDNLSADFKLFQTMSEAQSNLLTLIEKNGNMMPLTFVILPEINVVTKPPKPTTTIGKVKNYVIKKTSKIVNLVWNRSRVVFICPVTLKQVWK